MVKIPRKLADKAFIEKVRPGTVLRFPGFVFSNGSTRDKYLIYITHDAGGAAYYFLTTTNVARYQSKPWLIPYVVTVPAGTVTYFNEDTVIQCDRLRYDLTLTKLKERYAEGKLLIAGPLPAAVIEDIKAVVFSS